MEMCLADINMNQSAMKGIPLLPAEQEVALRISFSAFALSLLCFFENKIIL